MTEKINITFLGTGNAIPTKQRNHTGVFLSYKNENILIDCGEGIQRQFKLAGLNPGKLTKILISHWHGDHTLGLLGLLQTLAMSDYKKTLEIYMPKGTKKYFQVLEKTFLNQYNKISLKIHEVFSGTFIETEDFQISTLPMSHGLPSNAYSFEVKEKLRLDKKKIKKLKLPNTPLFKKLQQGKSIKINGKVVSASKVTYKEPGKKVTFIMDTLPNPNTLKISKNSDLLITESTFSKKDEGKAKEHKHLTAEQAAQIAKSSKSKSLILTHISQRYEQSLPDLLNEARSTFKNTRIAEDLDQIVL